MPAPTLRDCAAAGLTHLTIRCTRCPRAGRLSLRRLMAERGPDTTVLLLLVSLGADCPKREGSVYERCDRYCPDLRRVG
jgi:hypothetical protein